MAKMLGQHEFAYILLSKFNVCATFDCLGRKMSSVLISVRNYLKILASLQDCLCYLSSISVVVGFNCVIVSFESSYKKDTENPHFFNVYISNKNGCSLFSLFKTLFYLSVAAK